MLNALPEPLIECTLRGSALILVAIAAAPIVRRVFGQNGVHWLWIAALVALLCPVSPGTPFSLQNLWAPQASVTVLQNTQSSDIPIDASPVRSAPISGAPPATSPIAKPTPAVQFSMSELVLIIWTVGTVLLLCQLGFRWWQTMRLVCDAREVRDIRWERLLRRVGVERRIRLAVTSALRAPALAGIFQPKVLIPEAWLTEFEDCDLESVLLHELGHFRRGDLIWEWLFAIARCTHWMNPLVWWAERVARHERELGCDSWALERTSSPTRYGYALVAALQRVSLGTRGGFGVVPMAESAAQIERRLRWIARPRSGPSWLARLAVVPALLALLAIGTRPLPAEESAFKPESRASMKSRPVRPETKSTPQGPRPESVEVRTRLIRVPEKAAHALGLPIAPEGSQGINRTYAAQDFANLMATLRGTSDVEFLSTPRLLSKEGSRTSFDVTREFPYPESYEKPAEDLFVPVNIVQGWVGLRMESETEFVPPNALRLQVVAQLRRLSGFADKNGKFTPVLVPEQANWLERLTSWQMPPGAEGDPKFVAQNASSSFESFSPGDGALIFGFRDTGAEDESMINYIALEAALR